MAQDTLDTAQNTQAHETQPSDFLQTRFISQRTGTPMMVIDIARGQIDEKLTNRETKKL